MVVSFVLKFAWKGNVKIIGVLIIVYVEWFLLYLFMWTDDFQLKVGRQVARWLKCIWKILERSCHSLCYVHFMSGKCVRRTQRNVVGISSAVWVDKLQDIKLTIFTSANLSAFSSFVCCWRWLINIVIVVMKDESLNTVMLREAVIGLWLWFITNFPCNCLWSSLSVLYHLQCRLWYCQCFL